MRTVETDIYTFAARRPASLVAIVALEVIFHTLGVAEAFVVMRLITGSDPGLLNPFVLETTNRLVTEAFKFVPSQVGFGEAGSASVAELLGLGTLPGLTLSIVRKARMAVWTVAGTALLVRLGLGRNQISLTDPEVVVSPSARSHEP